MPIIKKLLGLQGIKGTAHSEDVAYLFRAKTDQAIEINSPEHKTILRMVQMWVNFANTGLPTNEKFEIQWPLIEDKKNVYLDINQALTIKEGFFKERMELWNEIWKLAGKGDQL